MISDLWDGGATSIAVLLFTGAILVPQAIGLLALFNWFAKIPPRRRGWLMMVCICGGHMSFLNQV